MLHCWRGTLGCWLGPANRPRCRGPEPERATAILKLIAEFHPAFAGFLDAKVDISRCRTCTEWRRIPVQLACSKYCLHFKYVLCV